MSSVRFNRARYKSATSSHKSRFLLFVESENLIPTPVSRSPGILADDHIRELQPVLPSERDSRHLSLPVCLVGGMRNFSDIGAEPALYRGHEHIKRATAKRSRNDMRSASICRLMEQSMTNAPDALLPSAKEVMQKIALAEAEEAEKAGANAGRGSRPRKRRSSISSETIGHLR